MDEIKLIIEPDPDDSEAAEVYADGEIDGRPYRFLLDTGAAKSSIIYDAYTATFERVGTNKSSGVFAPTNDDLITVLSVSVGPLTRERFTLTRTTDGPGVKNLIGMDLLRDHCCHFCFGDPPRVVVDAVDAPTATSTFEPLFLDQRFHPYVDVQFGDTTARAVWDTGASITVVDSGFIDRHPAFFERAGESTGTDAAGTSVETPMFVMSAALIGGRLFPPHRIAAVDLSALNATLEIPMTLILGYSTLSKANWLFDFPGRRWAITRWLGN